MRQILLLTGMHFREFYREPGIIFWAILFPILLALGLGMAFSGEGEQLRTVAVVGEVSASVNKEEIIGSEAFGTTRIQYRQATWDEAVTMLKRGQISIIKEYKDDTVIFHFDPANVDAKLAYLQLSDPDNRLEAGKFSILKQEGTRYIDFLVPGLLAMNIMMTCMWGISYSNVDKRNKKLLRRMVATPMKKYNYVLAQLLARITLSAVESALLYFVSDLVFDIPITGSLFALFIMFLAGNTAFTGIAMITSSRTSNTQIANGLLNLVILPMMVLSGIYFSYHNFPDFMIDIIQLLPLTMLADSVRGIFLEGMGLQEVLPEAGILFLLGAVLFTIGIRVYKWY